MPYKLYVVDNSPDTELRQLFSNIDCDYTHLPNNPGYGAGHNVGIRKALEAEASYHIVMNTDLSFNNDVVSPMLEYMEANPRVGHLMPKILNPDGSIQRLCKLVPTPFDLFARMFLPSTIKEILSKRFELHGSGYNKIMFVPYLSGCFMLLRTEALRKVGLFDERFFMYPEDIDLTRRIAEKYETIFFPDCVVIHEHAASSKKSVRMMWIHIFNLIKYFNKWGWIFDRGRTSLNKKTLSQNLSF
jgi:GT2 family glycosyltransferase